MLLPRIKALRLLIPLFPKLLQFQGKEKKAKIKKFKFIKTNKKEFYLIFNNFRITRVLRVIRVIRLVRIVKLYKTAMLARENILKRKKAKEKLSKLAKQNSGEYIYILILTYKKQLSISSR